MTELKLEQIRKEGSIRDTIDFPFPPKFRSNMKPVYKSYFPNGEYRNYTHLFPQESEYFEDDALAANVVNAIDTYLADLADKDGEDLLYGSINETVETAEFNNDARNDLLTDRYNLYYEASKKFCENLVVVLNKCKTAMREYELKLLHKTSQLSEGEQAKIKSIGRNAYVMFVVLFLLKLYRGLFKAKKAEFYEDHNFKHTDMGIPCEIIATNSGLSKMLKVMLLEYTKKDEKVDRYGLDEAIKQMEMFAGNDENDADSGDEDHAEGQRAQIEALAAKTRLSMEENNVKEEAEKAAREKARAENETKRLGEISKEKTAAAKTAKDNLEAARAKLTEPGITQANIEAINKEIAAYEAAAQSANAEKTTSDTEAKAEEEAETQRLKKVNEEEEKKKAEIEAIKKEIEQKEEEEKAIAERVRRKSKQAWTSFDVPVAFDKKRHESYIVLTFQDSNNKIPHGFVAVGAPLIEEGTHIQAFTRRMVDLFPFMLSANHLLPQHAGKDDMDSVASDEKI